MLNTVWLCLALCCFPLRKDWLEVFCWIFFLSQIFEVGIYNGLMTETWQCERLYRNHNHSLLLSTYIPMQDKTEGEFFMQRLRTPSAGSDSTGLPRTRATPARHLWHYFFHFLSPVQTLERDCWVSVKFLHASIPRKGSGSTTTTTIQKKVGKNSAANRKHTMVGQKYFEGANERLAG